MKVVFIQPKSFFTWESLNIGYLASYLKKYIPDIKIEFYSEFYDTNDDIVQGCKDADIIGISATSPQYKRGLELAKQLKRKDNKIIMGGFHVTNVGIQSEYIDTVVKGEGEQAMLEICQGNNNKEVHCDYIQNIDDIPFPDREVMRQKRNMHEVESKFGRRIIAILANRGCPYGCVFCASKSLWGRKIRSRSGENLFAEFDKITKDYHADYVTFSDDEMGVNQKQMMDFCELKIKNNNKIEWGCNAVCKDMTSELMQLMRTANCTDLWMGVESGDIGILGDMKKPNHLEHIRRIFRISKEFGFNRRAYCILGMPNENTDTISNTEKMLDEIQPDVVGFTILAPYPGTAFYNDTYKDVDWSDVDEYINNMTCSKHLTNEQLKYEQKRLVNKYKNNLAYRNTNG